MKHFKYVNVVYLFKVPKRSDQSDQSDQSDHSAHLEVRRNRIQNLEF